MLSKKKIMEQLSPIFLDVLDNYKPLSGKTSARDIESWDSLSHIRLMITIEKYYSIKFTASEVTDLDNVGQLIQLIITKLSAD